MSVKAIAAVLLLAQVLAAVGAPHHRAPADKKRKDKDNCVIVVMKNNATKAHKQKLFDDTDGDEANTYDNIFNGFHKCVKNPQQLQKLANDPNVEFLQDTIMVEPAVVGVPNTQQTLTAGLWNLDRIDQTPLARDYRFNYKYNGNGVRIYVIDSGLRATHSEFSGRVDPGLNFYTDRVSTDTTDCMGHGTHVASTAAGTTYGVAKGARIVPVRIFGCSGTTPMNIILAAMNWVATQAKGVINMSFGGGGDLAEDAAVKKLTDLGFHVVAAAGNENLDACTRSPARAPSAITVGNIASTDAKWSTSNWGPCVDIQAPGTNILGASYTSNTGTAYMTGTSMASPLVAGIVATILEQSAVSPANMASGLVAMAKSNYITGLPAGTPNKLVNNQWCFITNDVTGCRTVTITVRTDGYPSEMGWNIWQSCPFTQAAYSSITAANTQLTWTVCLAPRSYTFVARDSFGDGWGVGWFRVTMGTTTLIAQTTVTGTGLTRSFTVPLAAAEAKHAVQSAEAPMPVLMISESSTSTRSNGGVPSHNDHVSLLDDETQRLSGRRTTADPVPSLINADDVMPLKWLMAGAAFAGVGCGVLATVAIVAIHRYRQHADIAAPEELSEVECVPSPAATLQ